MKPEEQVSAEDLARALSEFSARMNVAILLLATQLESITAELLEAQKRLEREFTVH